MNSVGCVLGMRIRSGIGRSYRNYLFIFIRMRTFDEVSMIFLRWGLILQNNICWHEK